MQTTAPIHSVAASARDLRARGRVTHIRGHKRRGPLHLPWQLNLAATGAMGIVMAACVWLQM